MCQVRRWYPDQEVWAALEQDRAHPCTSRPTQRPMRTLRLRRISLPKGSPEDNPGGTLFSDIQLLILDNRTEADVATPQRRMSTHRRGRNRRKDRRIRISYLPGSHTL
jgi:hypothetical protein